MPITWRLSFINTDFRPMAACCVNYASSVYWVITSSLKHLNLMRFFNPSSVALKTTYLVGMVWPLAVISLVVSLITLYGQRYFKRDQA